MPSISLENINLQFPVIYDPRQLSFRKQLVKLLGFKRNKPDIYDATPAKHALRGVSINIKNGDRVGLIGRNGAGKSTLLHVMANIYKPDSGIVNIDGRTLPLFDINVGIEGEATGYENIILKAVCFGLTAKEAEALIPDIEEFTELGDALHTPVNTYSTGMGLRLAFGLVTAMKSDILLMDEIVAAGDANFHAKAKQRLNKLLDTANILVLASHGEAIIREYCNKAILINQGEILYFGEIDEAFGRYAQLTTNTGIKTRS